MCVRTRSRSDLMSLRKPPPAGGTFGPVAGVVAVFSLRGIFSPWRSRPASAPSHEAQDERHGGDDDEDEEQDLGDLGGAGRDAAEAEQRGDQRDDEEHDGVVQHGRSPRMTGGRRFRSRGGRQCSDAGGVPKICRVDKSIFRRRFNALRSPPALTALATLTWRRCAVAIAAARSSRVLHFVARASDGAGSPGLLTFADRYARPPMAAARQAVRTSNEGHVMKTTIAMMAMLGAAAL